MRCGQMLTRDGNYRTNLTPSGDEMVDELSVTQYVQASSNRESLTIIL